MYYGSRPCHFAKNYDWNIGYGLILINKRGVAKKSASGQPENRASWMSRYDSLTFNQYGREFPSGGINEAGLAVELMWLDDAEYPADPRIPSFGTLEWIQYQLDQHATVKDVVASASRVCIASEVKLHYLVADRSGNTASIEFLNGKLVSNSGKTMPFRVLTNDPYERSLQFLATRRIWRRTCCSRWHRVSATFRACFLRAATIFKN